MPRTSPLTPRAPDLEPLHARWLRSPDLRRADGGVLSWLGQDGTGFPYPEVGGLLLSLRGEERDREGGGSDERALVRWLEASLGPDGAVRERGLRYAFDTAIVAAGLERWGGSEPAVERARSFLRGCLTERVGQRDGPRDGHWSRAFGPHLLKLAVALPGEAALERLAAEFVEECWDGRWFHTEAGRGAVYPHAHAYALEGLAALRAQGARVDEGVLRAGLRSLLGSVGRVALSSDVVAQTLRLAVIEGEDGAEALRVLRARSAPGGGVAYRAEGEHINAWTTIFAVQALRWLRLGPDLRWLA